jgi:polyhydroxyalkanoate synthesis repressor PhaR
MSETRKITKFANRRLYDPALRRYITLEDIRELVLHDIDFSVVEKRGQRDVTGRTLLQVLVEQEQAEHPVFSRRVLEEAIRAAAPERFGRDVN